MKKYLLLLLLMIPINIYAYQLSCDDSASYGFDFYCHLRGDGSITYDLLTGDLTNPDSNKFECVYDSADDGLENIDSSGARFNLKGKPYSDKLVTFKCSFKVKPTDTFKTQLFINNFNYHEFDSNTDTKNEILRSNQVTINKYVDDTENNNNEKPRKTDNPNSRIKMIEDDNLNFTFSSFKTIYDIEVLFEVEKLNLKVTPNVEGETYEIVGNQTLEIGNNVIDVYGISPDGETKTCYTLNVKRLKRGEDIYYVEKDSTLSSLEISGYQINFEPIILEYTITINYDVDQVSVFAKPTNTKAKVDVSSSDNLKDGSVINVTVTSEDGSSSTVYLIHINKNREPLDYKKIAIITVIVLALGGVTILIIKTNQKNREDPLLRLKHDKRKVNKGEEFDATQVQSVQQVVVQTQPQVVPTPVPIQQAQPNQEAVQPVPVPTPVVPETPTPVEPVQQVETPVDNNIVNQ